jgi:hypothetical protein
MRPITVAMFTIFGLAIACTTSESTQSTSDSTSVAISATVGHVTPEPIHADITQDFEGTEVASLTTELLKIHPIAGTFISAEKVSENVLDLSNVEGTRRLLAIWIQSGEGEYQGTREQEYQTIHSRIAVFDLADTVTKLLDLKDFESSSQGLYLYQEMFETFDLTKQAKAIVIHHESSEEGAGDSGFSTDEIEVFAVKDNKLYSIFTTTLDESNFSSDEMGSYSESNTKREITILESTSNGLFDISIHTETTGTSFEAPAESEEVDAESEAISEETESSDPAETSTDESESTQSDESTEHEGDYPQEQPTIVYHWNGEQYVPEDVD